MTRWEEAIKVNGTGIIAGVWPVKYPEAGR